ncbi:acyltransferase family protein [Actinomadura alba]|uniref:acyltransferase family protein n=1 Tax=Actinomadura alba TaxID=406431 RepID=UPI0028A9E6FA|nr:acyltransferase family protein [Actinomadura alba]
MSAPAHTPGAPPQHDARPAAEPPSAGSGRPRTERRPEIQGLRAVAILLVASYHIWLGRVSGGVDVFLMLTGFLITGSLLRTAERTGRVQFAAFIARLARRLFPPAAIVLTAVLVGTLLLLPRTHWRDTLGEVLASALYFENWRLALTAVDYLAGGADASPVQHFWSLGIQGQFYLIWPALLAVAILVARVTPFTARAVFLVVLGLVLVVSLAYSVWRTETDQPWAYFDTGARLWELALGGIAAIVLPWIKTPRVLRVGLGWFGLAALISCGLLLHVSTMFPGYVALWPTGAAVLILLAGTTNSPIGADRLLASRPLKYAGDVSYSLYLWHWPLLIFYRVKIDGDVGLLAGGGILAVSFVLAAGTTWVTDHAAGWAGRARAARSWSLALGLACLLPVVFVTVGWSAQLEQESHDRVPHTDDLVRYPGAAVLMRRPVVEPPRLPIRPAPDVATQDLPSVYENDCMQNTRESELEQCSYGAKQPSHTITLIGNSHAAQWLPALEKMAAPNGWRIVVMTKGSCMLADEEQIYKGKPQPSCTAWQENVMAELKRRPPDLVITTGTHSSGTEGETLTPGMISRWRELGSMGVRVLALRDTPRFRFKAPECVEAKGRDECTEAESYSLAKISPILALRDAPVNVKFSDFTPYLCPNDRCPSVIGNVLVYWDSFGHFTATFTRTMTPLLERQVRQALQRQVTCMRPTPSGKCPKPPGGRVTPPAR